MEITEKIKIDTKFLPEGWKELGAEKFACSPSKIAKVASRVINDLEILEWLIDIGESEKQRIALIETRIAKLSKF